MRFRFRVEDRVQFLPKSREDKADGLRLRQARERQGTHSCHACRMWVFKIGPLLYPK